METIKTAVVVMLLLAVLYGVYNILNKKPGTPPPEIAGFTEPPTLQLEDLSGGVDAFGASSEFSLEQPADLSLGAPNSSLGLTELNDSNLNDGNLNGANLNGANSLPSDHSSTPLSIPDLPAMPSAPQLQSAPPTPQLGSAPSQPPGAGAGSEMSGAETVPFGSPVPGGAAESAQLSGGSFQTGPDNNPLAGADPESLAAAPSPPPPPAGTPPLPAPPEPAADRPFEQVRRTALAQIEREQWRDALFTLSMFYHEPGLTDDERQKLLDLLDPLAGRVIYSREHLLADPHYVAVGESLESIANQYQVPSTLLQNINGIANPRALASNTVLKVIPGPVTSEINLGRGELTLFVGSLYAGRFFFSAGADPQPREGEFVVKDKRPGQTYYSPTGAIQAGDPSNPYGQHWIDLGEYSIHGSAQNAAPGAASGCVSLAHKDAKDLYEILSIGSKVRIVR